MRHVALAVVAGLLVTCARAGSSGPAETHRFTPQTYYNTYSSGHPPALRIRPGDRVSTKTVDAAGADADGKTVTPGGNPETGPRAHLSGARAGRGGRAGCREPVGGRTHRPRRK